MTDTIIPNYTQEEIDEAKTELEQMTAEDLLNLKTQITVAEDAVTLPEAPAIAFMELRSASGAKINLTVRAGNGKLALDSLASAVAYAKERYAMSVVGTPHPSALLPMTAELPPEETPSQPVPSSAAYVTTTALPVTSGVPAQSSQASGVISDIAVESITRERKRDGKGDFLRVRGGKYTKFGVPCYEEHFPQGLDVSKMQYGIEFNQIPAFMKIATVNEDKPVRVIAFHG